jgi:hypothetical protein
MVRASQRRERRRCARKPEISAHGRWDGRRDRRCGRGPGLFGVLQVGALPPPPREHFEKP